ncbi:hypothetical protein [Arthrobacter castelli]|uniref:hypothetical protein n=1 Tax=Arthrobacter castelli TaxID=271431 RepID=UPI0003FCD242|nr:hypothetical protein [Arthrobacter castelli]
MSNGDEDRDQGIEAAAERIFRNLSESRRGGGTEDGRVPSDPNEDDEEVPAHSSISEGLNSTSADPVVDDEDDDGQTGKGSQ